MRLLTGITDAMLITTDGGQTFKPPFTINGGFTSFVRATDGRCTPAPRPAPSTCDRRREHFQRTPLPAPHLRCLGQRFGEPTRIYACGDMVLDGSSLFFSDDGGHTFTPVMKFTDLRGPLTCAPVQTNCAAHWERIQGVLGIGARSRRRRQGGGGGGGGGGFVRRFGCGSVGARTRRLS